MKRVLLHLGIRPDLHAVAVGEEPDAVVDRVVLDGHQVCGRIHVHCRQHLGEGRRIVGVEHHGRRRLPLPATRRRGRRAEDGLIFRKRDPVLFHQAMLAFQRRDQKVDLGHEGKGQNQHPRRAQDGLHVLERDGHLELGQVARELVRREERPLEVRRHEARPARVASAQRDLVLVGDDEQVGGADLHEHLQRRLEHLELLRAR